MHQRASSRFTPPNSRPKSSNCGPNSASANTPPTSLARKAEPAPTHPPDQATGISSSEPPRPRGQQRGRSSPPRRDYRHLPVVLEELELPADQQQCPNCGQPRAPFPGTADSELLEIEVSCLPPRRYRRHRYRPTCRCGCRPGIVSAATRSRQTHPQKSTGSVHPGHRAAGQVCSRPAHAAAPLPTSPKVTAWTCRPVRSLMVSSGWCLCSNLSTRLW